MSKSQRTKGASYEREVCHALSALVGAPIKRHIGQARDGGEDIPFGEFSIECKRRKTLTTLEGWYQQAQTSATPQLKIPVVVARADAGRSLVILSLEDWLGTVGRQYIPRPELPTETP